MGYILDEDLSFLTFSIISHAIIRHSLLLFETQKSELYSHIIFQSQSGQKRFSSPLVMRQLYSSNKIGAEDTSPTFER